MNGVDLGFGTYCVFLNWWSHTLFGFGKDDAIVSGKPNRDKSSKMTIVHNHM